MSIAIWLNRNYATTVHVIEQLRNNPDGRAVTIYGSHQDSSSPMLSACDYRFTESTLVGQAYADHALDFCLEHHIDVFLPVYEQYSVVCRAVDFARAGVAVIAPAAPAVALLGDKAATYRAVGDESGLLPPWRAAATADDFEAAVTELSEYGGPLVVKPVRGVGANGVRMLTDTTPTLAELSGPVSHAATLIDFIVALKSAEATGQPIAPLMLMPYLEEPEISVDVLADAGHPLVAVPRSKVGRDRHLDAPEEVLEHTALLVRRFALHGLVNVQFRQWRGRPVLLEINTRPSGGLYQTRLAGVNLPWAAVRLALGEPVPTLTPTLGARYVTVSALVALAP